MVSVSKVFEICEMNEGGVGVYENVEAWAKVTGSSNSQKTMRPTILFVAYGDSFLV